MISESYPEPLCDVAAQIRALRDPQHPKTAVWLAAGTPIPEDIDALIGLRSPEGLLLTTSHEKARRFQADPSDETLAVILDYIEPKSLIVGVPVVVQARSNGAVVLDMAVSRRHVGAAIERARQFGEVELISLPDAIMRRLTLSGMECPA